MLVIYDKNETVFLAGTGFPTPNRLGYMEVEIPEGKVFAGVSVKGNKATAVFKDKEKSDIEMLAETVAEFVNADVKGNANEPKTWVNGMIVEAGVYYKHKGVVYKGLVDSVYPLKGNIGKYVGEYFEVIS